MKHIYLGYQRTQLERIPNEEGESIEEALRRATENKEPIEAVAPMIYTDSKDGVIAAYDPRTDKQELVLDEIEKAKKSAIAKSQDAPDKQEPTQTKQDDNSELDF